MKVEYSPKEIAMSSSTNFDLEVSELRKSFASNPVLKGIDFTIHAGDFVGLMGPNGAGKSTLIKILAGVYTASSGTVKLGGQVVSSLAESDKVGFIHQELGLVDGLTIAENLRLGMPPKRLFGPILNRRAERDDALRALGRVGLPLHPDVPLGSLTAGEKTLVAVARVFDRGAKILVVDETTSTLPPSDARRVMQSLAMAAADGATVIMVTHKLSEILNFTNRVMVILDGELVSDTPTKGLDRKALVEKLRQNANDADLLRQECDVPTEGLIELREATIGKYGPINLRINSGEVIGISGLPGSGMHDVALAVAGSLNVTGGEIEVLRPGLKRALVPPHRESQGGFNELSVRENMSIGSLKQWRSRLMILNHRRERSDCETVIGDLSIKPNSSIATYDVLSGGNKQKVIFGRALLRRPEVYVLCEPTRGVDVGTRYEIYRIIRQIAKEGAGVLVASSDAEDLFAVCDKVALMANGALEALRDISELTEAELEMMV
jgi:ribose transport system ATP-binding protein